MESVQFAVCLSSFYLSPSIACFSYFLYADAHAIYLLNLLLAFLQPRFDPSLEADLTADELEEGGTDDYVPPSQRDKDDEFRPFVRRLPEWNFWQVCFLVPRNKSLIYPFQ